MSLQVIGTGFGRTGTLSLKLALEELGFGPCYHMIETRKHLAHDAMWLALATGQSDDWRAILRGYRSSVDWPAILVWRELIAANPDAKVILTIRDPESWYESASKTIFQRMSEHEDAQKEGRAAADPMRQEHMQMVNAVVLHGAFGGDLSRVRAIQVFEAHNEEVRRTVPPERLLVYEAGQGWAPLCAFLGVPEPGIPYPKVNSTADFAMRFPDE
jgi:hypothetical protein